MNFKKVIFAVMVSLAENLLGIVVDLITSIALTIPVYFLWKWLCPFFNLPALTGNQIWGFCFLCLVLFNGSAVCLEEWQTYSDEINFN